MPDSVVAQVAGRREITASQLRRAWLDDPGVPPEGPTPAEAARFLEVLVDRELLGEAATRETWEWTAAESAQIGALADRLAVSAALDSVLTETRRRISAAGDSSRLSDEDLGIAARDSTLARVGWSVDRALLARLAPAWARLPRPPADSSLAAQLRMISVLPEVADEDTGRVLARSPAGEYRVADLLSAWRRLHPAYRPRVDGPERLEELVRNGVFERLLRLEVARGGFAGRPAIEAEVARLRESFAVERLVRRDVVPAGAATAADLKRCYREHERNWRVPTRLRALRLLHDGEAEARRTASLLRDAAAAESLTASARRAGIEYEVELTAAADSTMFAAGLRAGPGTVLGPEPGPAGWAVARVLAVLPGGTRPLEEVRGEVERLWRAGETERRLRGLCGRLARDLGVRVNDRALERLTGPALDPPARGF